MGISSSSCLILEIPGHLGCSVVWCRISENRTQITKSAIMQTGRKIRVGTHMLVVFQQEKKRGKQTDGSDFCDDLHRIPW